MSGNLIEHKEFDANKPKNLWFKCRNKEDVYYKKGDIGINPSYNEISIVVAEPVSKDEWQRREARKEMMGGRNWSVCDDSDDCYLVLGYSATDDDTHCHPSAATLFPLTMNIPG